MPSVRRDISIYPKYKILIQASLTVRAICTFVELPSPSKKQYTITNSIQQTRRSLRIPSAEPLNYSIDRAIPPARNYCNLERSKLSFWTVFTAVEQTINSLNTDRLLFELPFLSRIRLSHHDLLRVKVLSAIFNFNRLPSLLRNVWMGLQDIRSLYAYS